MSATQIIRQYTETEADGQAGDWLAVFGRYSIRHAALFAFFLCLSLLTSCSIGEVGEDGPSCGSHPPDLASLTRIVVFGEVHGTQEAPGFIASSVCELAKRDAVVVGVEHPSSEQLTLDLFMAAETPVAGRAILAASGYWTRDGQDGKTSEAMLKLLERLRDLRRQGADVSVAAVGPVGFGAGNEIQANINRLATTSGARLVLLLGNAHTRKAGATGLDGQSAPMFIEPYKAIVFLHSGGSAWACAPSCEVQTLGPSRRNSEVTGEIVLDAALARFDGSVNLGAVHASPPALRVGPAAKRLASGG